MVNLFDKNENFPLQQPHEYFGRDAMRGVYFWRTASEARSNREAKVAKRAYHTACAPVVD